MMVKKILTILSLLILAVMLICAVTVDIRETYDGTGDRAIKNTDFAVRTTLLEEEFSLANRAIEEWMVGEYSAAQMYELYHSELGRLDSPIPVTIKFYLEGLPSDIGIAKQMVEISEYDDFSSVMEFPVDSYRDYAVIYNLKTNSKYYYRITVIASNGEKATAAGEFTTADTPRMILVEGIRNVRDIGGYKTVDGKTIKQGLLYRGTELRGTINEDFCVTEEGESVLVDDLGIRTEMDLRGEGEGGEPLRNGVGRKYYRLFYSYSEIFSDGGKKAMRNIFSDLAKDDTYPAYVHCTWGSDRTGTVCYLLQAVLGMSEDDCFSEWELTTFFNGGSYEKEMLQFIADVNALEGDTLKQKVENYLLSCGVTQEEIDSIREIFLTE